MKALLLNSGVGQRMGEMAKLKPKCLCEIGGGYTILSRQLTQLAKLGVREAVITVGPFAKLLEEHATNLSLPLRFTFVPNPLYDRTNYIYSMYLAAEHLQDDVLLLHGDLVLETEVLSDLISGGKTAAAVDFDLPLPEKDFKARMREGLITAIGVDLFGADCAASQPVYYWQQEDFAVWMASIARFVKRGEVKVYAENAFNELNGSVALHPLALHDRLCNEIDNLQDLKAVSGRFLQALEAEGRGV